MVFGRWAKRLRPSEHLVYIPEASRWQCEPILRELIDGCARSVAWTCRREGAQLRYRDVFKDKLLPRPIVLSTGLGFVVEGKLYTAAHVLQQQPLVDVTYGEGREAVPVDVAWRFSLAYRPFMRKGIRSGVLGERMIIDAERFCISDAADVATAPVGGPGTRGNLFRLRTFLRFRASVHSSVFASMLSAVDSPRESANTHHT